MFLLKGEWCIQLAHLPYHLQSSVVQKVPYVWSHNYIFSIALFPSPFPTSFRTSTLAKPSAQAAPRLSFHKRTACIQDCARYAPTKSSPPLAFHGPPNYAPRVSAIMEIFCSPRIHTYSIQCGNCVCTLGAHTHTRTGVRSHHSAMPRHLLCCRIKWSVYPQIVCAVRSFRRAGGPGGCKSPNYDLSIILRMQSVCIYTM